MSTTAGHRYIETDKNSLLTVIRTGILFQYSTVRFYICCFDNVCSYMLCADIDDVIITNNKMTSI